MTTQTPAQSRRMTVPDTNGTQRCVTIHLPAKGEDGHSNVMRWLVENDVPTDGVVAYRDAIVTDTEIHLIVFARDATGDKFLDGQRGFGKALLTVPLVVRPETYGL